VCFAISIFGLSIPVCITDVDHEAREAAFVKEVEYCTIAGQFRNEPPALDQDNSDRCKLVANEILRRWQDPQERQRMDAIQDEIRSRLGKP